MPAMQRSEGLSADVQRLERAVSDPDRLQSGRDTSSRKQPPPSEWIRLPDPRRSATAPDRGNAALKPLPLEPSQRLSPEIRTRKPKADNASKAKDAKGKTALLSLLQRCSTKICGCSPFKDAAATLPKAVASPETLPPRRWYRLHPQGDGEKYFVRPDAGLRGRIPGVARTSLLEGMEVNSKEDSKLQPDVLRVKSKRKGRTGRAQSLPCNVERDLGITEPLGFQSGNDTLRNVCRICYDKPIEVVLLPCRHGALCEECLHRTLMSRPAHRGGRQCPLCRAKIQEVVWIYGDAAIPQYGFTIKAI